MSPAQLIRKTIRLALEGDFRRLARAVRSRLRIQRHRLLKPILFDYQPDDAIPSPIVSVVIPCFNYGRFLGEAVDSVLAQTSKDVEVIVVEGGSTDPETIEIVRRLNHPRVQVLYQATSQLVGANRNFGLQHARGHYVCCLDADDTLDPTYLEKAVYALETFRYDVVSTGIRFTGEREGTIDVLEYPTLSDMTLGNHVVTCGVFRRDLWKQVGGYFDAGKGADHVAEDWDFWLRIAATGARIKNLSGEHLFNYRIHANGSLSSAIDVPQRETQRNAIIQRRAELLNTEAMGKSALSASVRFACNTPGGRLSQHYTPPAGSQRKLLVAVPFLIVGGAERLLASIIQHLSRQGWHVTIISTLSQSGHQSSVSWFSAASSEIYLLAQFLADRAEQENFIRYLLESRGFDAILIAGSALMYEMLPKIAAKSSPAVIDLLFNTEGHVANHGKFRSYIDFAVAENPEVLSWYKQQGWTSDRLKLIESGIDISHFDHKRPLDLAKQLGIPADDIVVGYSARLSEEKAPDVFLDIVRAFRGTVGVSFVMSGSGPMADSLKSQIDALPGDTRLHFLGHVDSTIELFALYDIFLLPSRIDGRPVALMEALASGCAIIASNLGGIPALLGGTGASVLCSPAQSAEFVDAIRELLADRGRLVQMKQNALAAGDKLVSVSEMASSYADALEQAISLKARS